MGPFQHVRIVVKGHDRPSALYLPISADICSMWLGFMNSVTSGREIEPQLYSMSFFDKEGLWVDGHWSGTSLVPHPLPIEDYWQLEYELVTVRQCMLTATENSIYWSGYCESISLRIATEYILKHQLEKLAKELER